MDKKELSPLKAHKELKSRYGKYFSLQDDERAKIIETTLKDYERVMVEKNDLFKRWTKEQKAFEIIKEKWVNVGKFMFCAIYNGAPLTWEKYDSGITWKQYSNKKLIKEEFDLLKEILKYEL